MYIIIVILLYYKLQFDRAMKLQIQVREQRFLILFHRSNIFWTAIALDGGTIKFKLFMHCWFPKYEEREDVITQL